MDDKPDKAEEQAWPEDQPPPEVDRTDAAPPQRRKISKEELETILKVHRHWAVSEGDKGTRAVLTSTDLSNMDLRLANLQGANLNRSNLQGVNLRGANLQGANLNGANLQGADLRGVNVQGAFLQQASLQGVNLHEADLRGADLRGADLEGGVVKKERGVDIELPAADLTGADMRNADLGDAKLSGATGLLAGKLAGADLSNAKVPEDIKSFAGLAHVAETSRTARKIFLGLLLGCVYSWLTIATTTDARLLTNSASSPLPIIQTEIPIAGFYFAAPVILLSLYLYFHFYMQHLWEGLVRLPAVFPDGRALHESACPWLLNGLVRGHLVRLKGGRSLFSRLEIWISILLAWWVVPATLLVFWVRYLPRHEWFGTILQATLVILAGAFGFISYWLARRTLRGQDTVFDWKERWRDGRTYVAAAIVLFALVMSGISYGAIDGVRSDKANLHTWVSHGFELVGYSTFADLRETDVSIKPEDWWKAEAERKEALEGIKGATLRGRNLRHADAFRAFLAKADLRNADLQGADLEEADLQRADLREANLQGTNLSFANLDGANLKLAWLQGTDLQGADLQGADLRFAVLLGAEGLSCDQLTLAKNWKMAYREGPLACDAPIPDLPANLGVP